MTGNSLIAIEHALIKNGNIVKLVCTFLSSYLKARSLVAFIESEKVNEGMERASVMVFVIAFFIPVIFLTLNTTFQIVKGGKDLRILLCDTR